jgi:hypothetical protein
LRLSACRVIGCDQTADCSLKFKIGAQVRISVRRIKFSMASAFPDTDVFRAAWAALDNAAH